MIYLRQVLPVVILVGLLGFRIVTVFRAHEQAWCQGCYISDLVRVWNTPDKRWGGYQFSHGRLRIRCGADVRGCQELASFKPGMVIGYSGAVHKTKDGRYELTAETVEVGSIQGREKVFVSLLTVIEEFRSRVLNMYRSYLSEPHASLLSGIIIGVQERFDLDFYQALVATGTLHVVAASGYNISIVAKVMLAALLLVMSRRTALAGTTLGVMGYVLMAGGNPAVVRAAVMGILAFGAQAFGKEYLSWWGLVAAASLMVLLDPEIVFSVSFQLSLAATAGIVWGVKPIERVLKWVIRNWGERWGNMQAGILTLILTDLSTTLAATLSTLPITLIVFNRVSVISPLVNVMLLWIVPPIMALGGVMVGLGMLSLWATGVVSWLVWPLLEVFIAVVEGFARLPWASIEIRGFSWWWGLGWWLVLASWWMTKEPKARRNSSRQEGTGKLKMLQEQHY